MFFLEDLLTAALRCVAERTCYRGGRDLHGDRHVAVFLFAGVRGMTLSLSATIERVYVGTELGIAFNFADGFQ